MLLKMLSAVVADDTCDAVLMPLPLSLYVPRLRSIYIETLRRIREQYPDRILMLCVRGPQDAVAELRAMGYPIIDSFDGCCATLAALARLRTALKKPEAASIAPSGERPAPLSCRCASPRVRRQAGAGGGRHSRPAGASGAGRRCGGARGG